uniref:Uncharacterized protein n=1 Tax=Pyxicephalus adspersus TaxID=30357 RepID=A0AAV2ZY64_PYXAD|nr:TPA: hypothetical protein GDO54_014456 [Pyxicephalus adspersus]
MPDKLTINITHFYLLVKQNKENTLYTRGSILDNLTRQVVPEGNTVPTKMWFGYREERGRTLMIHSILHIMICINEDVKLEWAFT